MAFMHLCGIEKSCVGVLLEHFINFEFAKVPHPDFNGCKRQRCVTIVFIKLHIPLLHSKYGIAIYRMTDIDKIYFRNSLLRCSVP